ncbi:MAG: 3-phosphoshikimate 1-carboxyvinyltransferase [Lachnospiraceae bacterium]|nr:3-phosphoshikimate 1-carboxyvinyltransferase [Lachnospiraceae bacterium]
MKLSHTSSLRGEITVPGDKSISHRSIMLGSIATGKTEISGFLKSADCISTMNAFRAMGIEITEVNDIITVNGKGLYGLQAPKETIDCGNSGTTTRILSGILAGQSFETTLTGDESIQKRPMKRVIDPLSEMGASITSVKGNGCAPLNIKPSQLHGTHITTKVASAQVKSAVILAGLYADGETTLTEPSLSRNHTELMLSSFGADIRSGSFEDPTAVIVPGNELHGQKITVPGDISSAAYFIGAGLITPDSEILVKNVGINPTRDGLIRVFKAMNANLELLNVREVAGEKVADILVKTSELKGTEISGDIIPTLIDELPLIAVVATQAEGETVIKDAAELKVKESNRIDLTVNNLKAMGADAEATDDGMIIRGKSELHHAQINTAKDHRIAMSFSIASLINADVQPVDILDAGCVNISYPEFYKDLDSLKK